MNEYLLIGASILLLISVLVSKISDRYGVPALLLFLILGMLAGSEGIGNIYFNDPALAQSVGILATFPLLAGLEQADLIFNIVFFVVLTSVLLQGTSIPFSAKWLQVDAPSVTKRVYPIEFTPMDGLKSELKELPIPPGSSLAEKAIFELGLPDDFLVILVARENDFMVPSGGTVLKAGDVLLVLSDTESFENVAARLHPPAG
jgi:cell volume regulation protein A